LACVAKQADRDIDRPRDFATYLMLIQHELHGARAALTFGDNTLYDWMLNIAVWCWRCALEHGIPQRDLSKPTVSARTQVGAVARLV
jgi:hypothetical protein